MAYSGKVINAYTKEPMANVKVSDGLNTVFTDSEGKFTLEGWDRAHVINVGILTNAHDDWYKMIDENDGDFDFYVYPANVSDTHFNFLHISDTELGDRNLTDVIPYMRKTVKDNSSAFFVHTGDICYEYGMSIHHMAMNHETMGCAVRYVIGNHDMVGEAYGEELYERLYGPCWYSFDCGNIHFIAMPIGYGDKPSGYPRRDAWEWIQRDLELMDKDKKPIILCHNDCELDLYGFCPDVQGLKTDLRKHGLIAWVWGHSHIHFVHDHDGVLSINTACPDRGGIESSPAGIRKISLAGHEITTEMVYDLNGADGVSDKYEWKAKLPGFIENTTPIEEEGDVFVATGDDGYPKDCGVFRLDGNSGRIKWRFTPKNGIKAEMAYDNGKLYAQDTSGALYCLDASSGELIWQMQSDIRVHGYTRNCVMVIGDKVLAGGSNYPHAYDKNTGKLLWRNNISPYFTSPARHLYDAKRNLFINADNWAGTFAHDVETGEIKWTAEGGSFWQTYSRPVMEGDRIYNKGASSVGVINADDGKKILEKDIGFGTNSSGSLAIDGDTLYVPTTSSGVVAIDKETLELKRVFTCGNTLMNIGPYIFGNQKEVHSSVVVKDDTVIFAAGDGHIYFYDKNTVRLKKQIKLGMPVLNDMIVKDDYVIVTCFDGSVMKFKI